MTTKSFRARCRSRFSCPCRHRRRRSVRHSRECPGRRQGADHRGRARSADPLPRLGRARRPRPRDARRRAGAPVSRGRAAVAGLSTRRREGRLGTDRRRGRHHGAAAGRVVVHGQDTATSISSCPTTTSRAPACRRRPPPSTTPGSCSSGYGIEAPEYKWDDFKGVDVKGKVLVMLNNDPDWDPKLFAGNTRLYYGRWTYKYESAARHGAAGVIIVHTTPSAGYPWQVVQSSWGGEQFELPAEGEPRIQLKGWATEAAARRLVKAGGQDLDKLIAAAKSRNFKPVPLALKTSIKVRQQGLARAHRERRGPAAGQRSRSSRTKWSSTPRTTTTSASATRTRPATTSTTAPKTTRRAARSCWPSRAPWRRCPSGRGVPCSCCSSRARSRGC